MRCCFSRPHFFCLAGVTLRIGRMAGSLSLRLLSQTKLRAILFAKSAPLQAPLCAYPPRFEKKRCRTAKEKRFLVLRCIPLNDRRMKSGYSLLLFPLPLHCTMLPCTHPNRLRLVCLAFGTGVACGRSALPQLPDGIDLSSQAAHDRAPRLGANMQQACIVGLAVSYDCQRSGSGKWE